MNIITAERDGEMLQRRYKILNIALALESDSEDFLEAFHRDYSWFEADSPEGHPFIHVSLRHEGTNGGAFLQIRAQHPTGNTQHMFTPLEEHPAPINYAYQAVNRLLMEEARDFVILHGGGIAAGDQAVIISGLPGAGKTTLVMALLEEGFTLLSDDFCPIHRKMRLVHPFPRSLYLSRRSQFAPRNLNARTEGCLRGGKVPLRPDREGIAVAGGPCRLKELICLDPGESAHTGWCELAIGLKEDAERTFLEAAYEIPGVILEKETEVSCAWRLRYPKEEGLAGKVKELLSRYREAIWNVFRISTIHPDFSREPVLTPIAVHEAAFFVLQELKQQPDLGGSSATKAGEYFMELNELLDGVSCYRLTCGRLDRLKELVMVATKEPEVRGQMPEIRNCEP